MKNKALYYIAASLFAASAAWAVEQVNLRITAADGTTSTKQVKLENVGENIARLTIKKDDLQGLDHLDVIAPCAVQKAGAKGFWMCNRGFLGDFSAKRSGLWTRGRSYLSLPYYAMQTEDETFIAMIDGMRFECEVRAEAKDGKGDLAPLYYEFFPRFNLTKEKIGFAPYEDIVITYYKLPQNADYNQMAKVYRKHKEKLLPGLKPMKERFATQPLLKEHAEALSTRIIFGYKKPPNRNDPKQREAYLKHRQTDYTYENDQKVYANPFSFGTKVLEEAKKHGIDKLYICTQGWQDGGYDGRTPSTWPICKEAGGEAELVKHLKIAKEMGYLVDAHMDYTDCYTCSHLYSDDLVCKGPDGKREINGSWAGGRAYNLCVRNAWEKWAPAEMEKIQGLGFRGGMFFDVFGAVYPYRCCDPKHPYNRKEGAQYHRLIVEKARNLFGVTGMECEFDDYMDVVDFINYPGCAETDMFRKMDDPVAEKGWRSLPYIVVPFWELAYHDAVLSTPYRYAAPRTPRDKLKLVEFCGRPIYYSIAIKDIPEFKKTYDFYKEYRDLMVEEMTSHKKLADGVFKTTFGNGAYVLVNYGDKPYNYNGMAIVPPMGYKIVRK